MMTKAIGYDPYEWFDPERGRPERVRLNSLAHLAVGRGQVKPDVVRTLLIKYGDVDRLNDLPLDALGRILAIFEAMKRDTTT